MEELQKRIEELEKEVNNLKGKQLYYNPPHICSPCNLPHYPPYYPPNQNPPSPFYPQFTGEPPTTNFTP